MIEKGKEYREREILDYHTKELSNETNSEKKNHKMIINRIVWNQRRIHTFYYLLKYAGKGVRRNIKKLVIKGANREVIKSYLDRTSIENELLQFNNNHFQKAKDSNVYKDKTYKKLRSNKVRNKTL